MARFSPFRGTVYDTARVKLSDVVAPPYDVVGTEERERLAARSPYNAIRVELPEDPTGGDRYEHAAELWRSWHDETAVRRDAEAAFYLYAMTFQAAGGRRTSRGVVGALGLDPEQRGEVLPHEETTPKDLSDRLSLLRSARTNFSPIWGLSLARGLSELCDEAAAVSGEPWEATDDDGAVHTCWRLVDGTLQHEIAERIASAPVLIADGHHRYETACAYLTSDDGPGSDAVMAFVVELSERELAVEAIHRLVGGTGPGELRDALSDIFEVLPGPADPLQLYEEMGRSGAPGLWTDGSGSLLLPRERRGANQELATVTVARALSALPTAKVSYRHGVLEVAAEVRAGRATAAILLRPVSVAEIAETAHGGRRMPPKTTFFRPKLRTGMVFRELDELS